MARGRDGVVDEATDALGAMVAAVLDDQAAVRDTLRHQRLSSMVYVRSSKATYSNTVAKVRQTRYVAGFPSLADGVWTKHIAGLPSLVDGVWTKEIVVWTKVQLSNS